MQSVKFRKRLKYAKTHIIFIIVNFVNINPIICISFEHNIVINKDKHFFGTKIWIKIFSPKQIFVHHLSKQHHVYIIKFYKK